MTIFLSLNYINFTSRKSKLQTQKKRGTPIQVTKIETFFGQKKEKKKEKDELNSKMSDFSFSKKLFNRLGYFCKQEDICVRRNRYLQMLKMKPLFVCLLLLLYKFCFHIPLISVGIMWLMPLGAQKWNRKWMDLECFGIKKNYVVY